MATVCQTCGDQGFVEALIYCDSCEISAMHRYCLDISPVPFEDYITWFCTTCNGSDSDREEVDQTAKLKNILKKEKKQTKKKKKLRVDPELDEMNIKSSNFSSEVVCRFEDHGLQDGTSVEPAKMVCTGSNSGSDREEVRHVLKKKKKKLRLNPELDEINKKSSSFSSEVLGRSEGHRLQDSTSVEPAKIACTQDDTNVEPAKMACTQDGTKVEPTKMVCTGGNSGSDHEEADQTAKLRHVLQKKKKKLRVNPKLDEINKKSSNLRSEVLGKIEDHGLHDDTNVEPAKMACTQDGINVEPAKMACTQDGINVEPAKMACTESNSGSDHEEADQTAKLRHVQKKKKKMTKKKKKLRVNPELDEMNKKSSNVSSEVVGRFEDHGLQDGTNVEPAEMACDATNVEPAKMACDGTNVEPAEMACDGTNVEPAEMACDGTNVEPRKMACTGSNSGSGRKEVDQTAKLTHDLKKKKKKKKLRVNPELDEINKNSSNFNSEVLGRSEDNGLEEGTSVESAKIACAGGNSGPDHEEVDQTAKLINFLKKKKKTTKKKKLRGNLELDEMNKKSSNVSSEGLGRFEDYRLQDGTNVEPAKMACDGTNVEPAKMTCDGTNVEPAKMACDGTNVEPRKMACTGSISGSDCKEVDQTAKLTHVLKKKQKMMNKKRKQKVNPDLDEINKKSSNIGSPVLGKFEDHGPQDGDNVELVNVSALPNQEKVKDSEKLENSESREPHKLTGLDSNGSSVLEASNSSTVPDHDSSTNKKRKLSSGNCDEEPDSFKPKTPFAASENCPNKLLRTCENNQLAVWKSSCNDVVSNKPQTSEGSTDLHFNSRAAQPVIQPIWRGSLSIQQGNIHCIDGLVAHLSRLACPKVYEVASSLHNRLSAEMFPRLDIWPRSFLQKRGPTDESIALYFFPSESNQKVFDSLVLEMKNKDFAMRAILDDAELLLFTSVTLPVHFWTFQAKYYLWGVFRAKQKFRHM